MAISKEKSLKSDNFGTFLFHKNPLYNYNGFFFCHQVVKIHQRKNSLPKLIMHELLWKMSAMR
jgi:hypothetical protein